MEYATLNNGVKMPMAGIGTFLLSPDEAEASVLSALADGYRLIDTANAYVNEKAVGRAMKRSGLQREEIFLETKIWPSFYEQADAVDKTLTRLGTEYIDLLLIHQPAGNYVAGYRLMEAAYKAGKVRAIGLSNFNAAQITEILSICEVKPTVLQTELHPYHQEKQLKAMLAENGIVPQAWYPLGHGDKALLEEPLFAELGRKYGKTSAQIILRWHIQGEFRFVRFCADQCGNGADCCAEQGCSLLHQHAGAAQEVCADGAAGRRAEVNRFPSLTGCFGSPFFFPRLAQKS